GIRLKMLELVGNISLQSKGVHEGIKGLRIRLYEKGTWRQITTLVSDSEGNFGYLGLKKGKYIAQLDRKQLKILRLEAEEDTVEFEIYGEHGNGDPLQFQVSFKR
ncbi:MAG: hypothetical protein AB3N16_06075, partial [Flavobacteriaceae bacterium]